MQLYLNEIKYTSDNIVITSDVHLDLTQDVIDSSNFYLYYMEENTPVPITLLNIVVTSNIITIETEQLKNNKMYELVVFSIPGSAVENFVPRQTFRFLSIDNVTNKITNPNNVYTQLQGINDLLSLEALTKKEENYHLRFNPTTFNTLSGQVEMLPEVVNISNNEVVLEKLVDQYFIEYKEFYKILNNREAEATPYASYYDDDYVNNIHLMFMKNITRWYSLKGNKTFIEIMLGLYAKFLGYNVISVVENTAKNFVYNVSSSIPTIIWDTKIKPFVHPLSWSCTYNEITSTGGKQYQVPDKNTKKNTMLFTWDIADANRKKLLDIRCSDKNAFIWNSIAIRDMVSEASNNSMAYATDFEYDLNKVGLNFNEEFDNEDFFSTVSTTGVENTHTKSTIKYSKLGFATKYEWDLYVDDVLVQKQFTSTNQVTFVYANAPAKKIQLTLHYKNGSYPLSEMYNL